MRLSGLPTHGGGAAHDSRFAEEKQELVLQKARLGCVELVGVVVLSGAQTPFVPFNNRGGLGKCQRVLLLSASVR